MLTRGKPKVLGELSLIFSLYNIRRSMSILGFKGLLKRIKALKTGIFEHLMIWCSTDRERMDIFMRDLIVDITFN